MPHLAALLRRLDGWVAAAEGALLVTLLGTLVVAGFWQVAVRNLGHPAAVWVDTFNRHLVMWIGLLGATLATRDKKHVNIEAVRKFLPRFLERGVETALHLFAAAVSGIFAWASWNFVAGERAEHRVLFRVEAFDLAVPVWITEIILPAAFSIIAARYLAYFLAAAAGLAPDEASDLEGAPPLP